MRSVFDYLSTKSFKAGLCLCFLLNNVTLDAQDSVMKGLDSLETILHIQCDPPIGFNNLNVVQFWGSGNSPAGRILCGVFESGDRQCKVLYNLFPTYPGCACYTHRDKMRLEGISNDCLRILPTEEAQTRFNADSIFLYDIPMATFENDEKFTHCTKMVITRQDRPELEFIWYFTDKGKKEEEKYMQEINKRIWYSDGNMDCNSRQRWEEWMKKYFVEITKKYFITRHDADCSLLGAGASACVGQGNGQHTHPLNR
jgi:hypothetical protein